MKTFLIFLSLAACAYTLDYPGDTPPLDTNPNWVDPTKPRDLNHPDAPELSGIQQRLLELDEKKLIKLKKALDVLFEDEAQEVVEEIAEPIEEIKPDPSEYIKINIVGEGLAKPSKAKKPLKNKSTPANQNIQINIQ